MKMNKAMPAVREIRAENTLLKIGFAVLIVSNGFLGLKVATRQTEIVLVPPFQNEEIRFINGMANRDYYQSWAWSTSMLLGNITPGNAKFLRGELERMATPALYRDLVEVVDIELETILRDKAAVRFNPREVTYDPNLDLFFVEGTQYLEGPGSVKPITKKLTFELGFTTRRLRIFLNRFDVYEGPPRVHSIREETLQKIAEQQAKEQEEE